MRDPNRKGRGLRDVLFAGILVVGLLRKDACFRRVLIRQATVNLPITTPRSEPLPSNELVIAALRSSETVLKMHAIEH